MHLIFKGVLFFLFSWALASCSPGKNQIEEHDEETTAIGSLGMNLMSQLDTVSPLTETESSRIAISSTTHIPFLKALGLDDRIVATAWAEFVLDPELKKRIENGKVLNLTRGEKLNKEALVASGARVLFYDPQVTDVDELGSELGIRTIPIAEYQEVHPLTRTMWVKLFGRLFGLESQADHIYNGIENRYMDLSTRASKVDSFPKVIMGSVYQGVWYAPGDKSLSAQWIRDAGGRYSFGHRDGSTSSSKGNMKIDLEELIVWKDSFDFLGFMGAGTHDNALKTILGDSRLNDMKALRTGNVFYCNTKKADYFGKGILEPDIILADLIKVLHPELIPLHEPVYFRRIQDR